MLCAMWREAGRVPPSWLIKFTVLLCEEACAIQFTVKSFLAQATSSKMQVKSFIAFSIEAARET